MNSEQIKAYNSQIIQFATKLIEVSKKANTETEALAIQQLCSQIITLCNEDINTPLDVQKEQVRSGLISQLKQKSISKVAMDLEYEYKNQDELAVNIDKLEKEIKDKTLPKNLKDELSTYMKIKHNTYDAQLSTIVNSSRDFDSEQVKVEMNQKMKGELETWNKELDIINDILTIMQENSKDIKTDAIVIQKTPDGNVQKEFPELRIFLELSLNYFKKYNLSGTTEAQKYFNSYFLIKEKNGVQNPQQPTSQQSQLSNSELEQRIRNLIANSVNDYYYRMLIRMGRGRTQADTNIENYFIQIIFGFIMNKINSNDAIFTTKINSILANSTGFNQFIPQLINSVNGKKPEEWNGLVYGELNNYFNQYNA